MGKVLTLLLIILFSGTLTPRNVARIHELIVELATY